MASPIPLEAPLTKIKLSAIRVMLAIVLRGGVVGRVELPAPALRYNRLWGLVLGFRLGRSRASCVSRLGVLLVLLCSGCASDRAAEVPSVDAGPAAPDGIVRPGFASTPLGDGSRSERLAELAQGTGIRGARVRCEDAAWKRMQPDPAGPIDFSNLDAFVAAHQTRGMSELLICLDTGARTPAPRGELAARGEVPPAAELEAFAGWVAAVVERYDADGVSDMPQLRQPVRFYEVGIEFSSRSRPGLDAYLLLLDRAHRAAHAAYSEVIVAHAAWLLAAPPDGADPARLGLLAAEDRERILEHPERFDAVNLQVVADAAALDVALAELRASMARRGFRKPVIISHLAPSPLVGWGRATSCESGDGDLGLVLGPARSGDRCALAEHFRRLLAADPGALAWTWRFAAAELVRKSVVAASHDVMAAFVGPAEDTTWWRESAFEAAAGVTAWSGLVNTETGARRPAHTALEQLGRVFEGRERVRRVDMGDPAVRLYAVTGPPGTVWIGWHETGALTLPGEESREIEIEFDLRESGLEVTPLAGLTPGPPSQRPPTDARQRARVVLTEEPLYLTPAPIRAARQGAKP